MKNLEGINGGGLIMDENFVTLCEMLKFFRLCFVSDGKPSTWYNYKPETIDKFCNVITEILNSDKMVIDKNKFKKELLKNKTVTEMANAPLNNVITFNYEFKLTAQRNVEKELFEYMKTEKGKKVREQMDEEVADRMIDYFEKNYGFKKR